MTVALKRPVLPLSYEQRAVFVRLVYVPGCQQLQECISRTHEEVLNACAKCLPDLRLRSARTLDVQPGPVVDIQSLIRFKIYFLKRPFRR